MIQPYSLTPMLGREIFYRGLEIKFQLQLRFRENIKFDIESPIKSPIESPIQSLY